MLFSGHLWSFLLGVINHARLLHWMKYKDLQVGIVWEPDHTSLP